jgi:hypothetical protein
MHAITWYPRKEKEPEKITDLLASARQYLAASSNSTVTEGHFLHATQSKEKSRQVNNALLQACGMIKLILRNFFLLFHGIICSDPRVNDASKRCALQNWGPMSFAQTSTTSPSKQWGSVMLKNASTNRRVLDCKVCLLDGKPYIRCTHSSAKETPGSETKLNSGSRNKSMLSCT